MRADALFLQRLTASLRAGQRRALLPSLIAAAIALPWLGLRADPGLWPLGLLALGLCATAALTWGQARLIDQSFLPQLIESCALRPEPSGKSLCERLPKGLVSRGTQQVVLNALSGSQAGRLWQAGFLECSHRDLETGSTRAVFRGQLLQLRCETPLPDFLLRPKGLRLSADKRLSPMGLPKALEVAAGGRNWSLYTGAGADELARRGGAVLARLPEPPRSAEILGLVYAQGWLQLLCANRCDLFSLSKGLFPALNPDKALRRSLDALAWAESAAAALAAFDTPFPERLSVDAMKGV